MAGSERKVAPIDANTSTSKTVRGRVREPRVSFFKLFRFATKFDAFIMVLGLFGSALAGSAQPMFTLFFGDIMEGFIGFSRFKACETFPVPTNMSAGASIYVSVIESVSPLTIQNGFARFPPTFISALNHNCQPGFCIPTNLTADATVVDPSFKAVFDNHLSPLHRSTSVIGNMVWSYMCAGNSTTQTDDGWIPHNQVVSYAMGTADYPFGGEWNMSYIQASKSVPTTGDELVTVIVGYIYFFFIAGSVILFGGFLSSAMWTLAGERQGASIQKAYLRALLRQDSAWYDESKVGELSSRISGDIVVVTNGITDKLSTFLENFIRFIVCAVLAFTSCWQLALVLLVVMPIIGIVGVFFGRMQATMSMKNQKGYAMAGAVAQEVLSSIRTVASLTIEKLVADKYEKEIVVAEKASRKKVLVAALGTAMFVVVLFNTYALSFWFGSIIVDSKWAGGGDVLTAFFSMLIGSFAMSEALSMVSAFNQARGAAFRINEVIERRPVIDPYSEEGEKVEHPRGVISFENVKFRYPTRPDVEVLKGLTLHIKVGETVAFVGHSGCGKSTTVSLIQRLYDVESGSVKFDGVDVRHLNLKWMREQMAIVSQEPTLFEGNIMDNIRFGRPTATEEEVIEAAKKANAHSFISTLTQKYGTKVGEKGAQLSGGQKQRIAIARALLLNPCVMLLDEATSALDASSESIVQQALDKAMEGRTTIVIAHRLSTVRRADRICVFDAGEVVEEGTYDGLIAKNGHFKHLVDLQMGTVVGGEVEGEGEGGEEEDKAEQKEGGGVVDVDAADLDVEHAVVKPLSRKTTEMELSGDAAQRHAEAEAADIVPYVPMSRIAQLSRPDIGLFLLGLLGSILRGALVPINGLIMGEIFNTYQLTGDELRQEASFWSLMFVALAFSSAITEFFERFSFLEMGEKLTTRTRRLLFNALLRQNVGWFDSDKHSSGHLTSRLATDTTLMNGIYGERLGQLLRFASTLTAGMIVAFSASWQVTLVILAIFPLIFLSNVLRMRAMKKTMQGSKSVQDVDSVATEAITNIRTVAAFVAEERTLEKLNLSLNDKLEKERKSAMIGGVTYGISSSMFYFAFSLIFWYGALLIGQGELTMDSLMKVFFSIFFAAMTLAQAASIGTSYKKAREAANNIFAVVDRKPFIDSSNDEGLKPDTLKGSVVIKNVHFRYPSRPYAPVLEGVSLEVQPGQTMALVGASGCGKSTTISLVQRFYTPFKGEVYVDGIEVRKWSLPYLRSHIGVVGQEPVLFGTTIRENIRYGKKGATDAEIEEALRIANAAEFVHGLPDGLDTEVGERGTQLSGGQKQRIAIARAIVRNPPLLLLDEATSALDAKSERVVQDALDSAMKGRSTIVIAHRLSTIRNADCIYVFHAGEVVEKGTHDELVAMDGEYNRLVKLQMTDSKGE